MNTTQLPLISHTHSGSGYPMQYSPPDSQAAWHARVDFFNQPRVRQILSDNRINPDRALSHSSFVQGRDSRDIVVDFQDDPEQDPVWYLVQENDPVHNFAKAALIGPAAPAPRPTPTPTPIPTPAPASPSETGALPTLVPPSDGAAANSTAPSTTLRQQQREFLEFTAQQTEAFQDSMSRVNEQRHAEMRELMQRMQEMQTQQATLFDRVDARRSNDAAALRAQIAALQAQQTTLQRDWMDLINEMDTRHGEELLRAQRMARVPAGPLPQIPVPPAPPRGGDPGRGGPPPGDFGMGFGVGLAIGSAFAAHRGRAPVHAPTGLRQPRQIVQVGDDGEPIDEDSDDHIQALEEERDLSHARAEELQQEIRVLGQHLQEAQAQLQEAILNRRLAEETLAQRQRELDEQRGKVQQHIDRINAEFQQQIRGLEAELAPLRLLPGALADAHQANDDLRVQLAQLTERAQGNDQLQKRIRQLEDQLGPLEDLQGERDQLQADTLRVQQEIAQLRADVQRHLDAEQGLQQQLELLQRQKAEAEERVEAADRKVVEEQRQSKEALEQHQKTTAESEERRREIGQLREEHQQQLTALKTEFADAAGLKEKLLASQETAKFAEKLLRSLQNEQVANNQANEERIQILTEVNANLHRRFEETRRAEDNSTQHPIAGLD